MLRVRDNRAVSECVRDTYGGNIVTLPSLVWNLEPLALTRVGKPRLLYLETLLDRLPIFFVVTHKHVMDYLNQRFCAAQLLRLDDTQDALDALYKDITGN